MKRPTETPALPVPAKKQGRSAPWNKGLHKREEEKFPERDEVEQILKAAEKKGPREFMLLFLASHMGLRSIEVVSMKVEDFDLEKDRVVIHTAKQKQGKPVDDWIPLIPLVRARVQDYLKSVKNESGWLFPGPGSDHLTTRTARNIYESCAKEAGVRPSLSLHSMRHHAGVVIYRLTKNIKVVARYLRHRSEKNAWKYVHATYEDLEEMVKDFPVLGLGRRSEKK